MECRTLSQRCSRLYFLIFLFRVGLFILIYMVSLMALAISLVVMEGKNTSKKTRALLEDFGTYRHIPIDPTNKHKNRLINILKNMTAKNMTAESGRSENTYKMMYPTGASAPKFYGLAKIHKKDVPLRPNCV